MAQQASSLEAVKAHKEELARQVGGWGVLTYLVDCLPFKVYQELFASHSFPCHEETIEIIETIETTPPPPPPLTLTLTHVM